jgi:hypothetical protein
MNIERTEQFSGSRPYWLLLVCGLVVLMVGLLVGPRVPNDQQHAQCVTNLLFAGPFGISLNCDSMEFMRLARDPAALLEPQNRRQARPGLIFAAAALAVPLSPMKRLAEKLKVRARGIGPWPIWLRGRLVYMDAPGLEDALAKYFPVYAPYYAAYIILNVLILLVSFDFFRRICARSAKVENATGTAVLVSACFLLASNDVVKQFVWSPHTQMLNILVPLFAMWVSIRAAEGALLDRHFVLLTGFTSGLGGTAYFFFIIVLPCILVPSIIFTIRYRSWAAFWWCSRNFGLLVILTFLPIAIWYLFVRYETGGFFANELVDIQDNWLSAAWQHGYGAVFYAWMRNLGGLLNLAASQAVPVVALFVLVGAIAIMTWNKNSGVFRRQVPVMLSGLLVAAISLAFYATNGAITPRLSFACIPPLIVVAGAVALEVSGGLEGVQRAILVYGSAIIAISHSVVVVLEAQNYPDI